MAHMRIPLDRRADRVGRPPLARQIQLHIERLVSQRLLAPGVKLPATRELAKELGVNRTTVALAYDELVAAAGAGPPPESPQVTAPPGGRRRADGRVPHPAPGVISLPGGMPDGSLFPTDA